MRPLRLARPVLEPGRVPRGLEARDGHRRTTRSTSCPPRRSSRRAPWRPSARDAAVGAPRRDPAGERPRLRRRGRGGDRGRDPAGQEPDRRAGPVAVHRRRPGRAHPGPGAAARHLVRRRADGAGRHLRADRLLPDRDRDHGRHPLAPIRCWSRCCASLGARESQSDPAARDSVGPAGHVRRAAGGRHPGGHRRGRGRVGRRQRRARRPHQHRQPGPVRHPAHVRRPRHAGPPRPGRSTAVVLRRARARPQP